MFVVCCLLFVLCSLFVCSFLILFHLCLFYNFLLFDARMLVALMLYMVASFARYYPSNSILAVRYACLATLVGTLFYLPSLVVLNFSYSSLFFVVDFN